MARRSSALVTAMGRNDHHHHNHDVHHEHHWTNWGGNQHVHPADVVTPSTEAELEAIVGRGERVRAVRHRIARLTWHVTVRCCIVPSE